MQHGILLDIVDIINYKIFKIMKVESICIVGGGSSGWMSAAALSKLFPQIEVALIESEISKPIGVGESTLGHFNRFLSRLELKDKDWMPHCNATYKTSIAFQNFRQGEGERFQYPFGKWDFDYYKNHLTVFFELQKQYGKELYPEEEFARFYNMNTFLADECKMADSIPSSNYNPSVDTAYHLDAELFGQYLRDHIAIPNGVTHLLGDVENVVKRPDGSIESLITTTGGIISADLYLDCTGFKSLLLEQHMGVEFISFNDQLFNDRALATQVPYNDRVNQMETYTDCVAMNCGWVWNIPLWHRVGTGYVYSSKYISDADAELEFREYLAGRYTPEVAQNCQLRPIKIKHGKHKVAWKKNVIGIGLSYGFLEPLESTGLMTTHENILCLTDILDRRDGFVSKIDVDTFNWKAEAPLTAMKNFVAIHYTLSQRQHNQYWKDATENIELMPVFEDSCPAALRASEGYVSLIQNPEAAYRNDDTQGFAYIMAGLGYNPVSKLLIDERQKLVDATGNIEGNIECNIELAHIAWQQDRKVMLQWVRNQSSHYEYLKDNIYETDEYISEKTVG